MSQPVCIVTGASRGIGFAVADRMSQRGFAIVAVARNEPNLHASVEQLGRTGATIIGIAADVATTAGAEAAVRAAIDKFGRIDGLVNNAGAAPLAKIPEFTDAQLTECIDANIASTFRMTRAAWPHLSRAGGTIVNISSLASVDPFAGFAVYGACKTWINAFTSAAANEGRAARIRVFAVAPGAVETRMLRQHFPDFPADATLAPDEIAAAVSRCFDIELDDKLGQVIFVKK